MPGKIIFAYGDDRDFFPGKDFTDDRFILKDGGKALLKDYLGRGGNFGAGLFRLSAAHSRDLTIEFLLPGETRTAQELGLNPQHVVSVSVASKESYLQFIESRKRKYP